MYSDLVSIFLFTYYSDKNSNIVCLDECKTLKVSPQYTPI